MSAGLNRVAVEEYAGIDPEDEGIVRFTGDVSDALKATAPEDSRQRSPPPGYPASEASSSFRPAPPPAFSELFASSSPDPPLDPTYVLESFSDAGVLVAGVSVAGTDAPAYAPLASGSSEQSNSSSFQDETKRALPQDTKREGASSRSKEDEAEPPPAYSEGPIPLQSFTYLMAAAGGASSIITQVQQGGPPINAIGGARDTKSGWLASSS